MSTKKIKVLILAAHKVLQRWSANEINRIGADSVQLVTSQCNNASKELIHKNLDKYSNDITYIENYNTSGLIPVLLAEFIEQQQITHIIALSEVDIMRAARLRDKFNLPGLKAASAIYFRDKHVMKQSAIDSGIACSPFQLVYDPLTLQQTAKKMGYPVVLKPTMGRGSSGVVVLEDDKSLRDYLTTCHWNDLGGQMPMLLEKYVDGDLYRVDGVVSGGNMCFVATARYWGTHLDYLNGGCLGSVMLDPASKISKKLVNLTKKLLLDVLPFGLNGGFHVEIFINNQGELIFNEAAARLGGGSIIEEIETSYGINIKTLTVAAEAENTSAVCEILNDAHKTFIDAAQLHISPRLGELVYIPENCPLPCVSFYESIGRAGENYNLMNHTNSEVARFILTGTGGKDLTYLLDEVLAWFNDEIKWLEKQDGLNRH
ncbi:ATP-grasp domain-containing protein [SAR92 clade bacterium H921]|nr:ATP-grasp domain-containing protein [SAR92 clade bacterium H921]